MKFVTELRPEYARQENSAIENQLVPFAKTLVGVTIPEDGKYLIEANVLFQSTPAYGDYGNINLAIGGLPILSGLGLGGVEKADPFQAVFNLTQGTSISLQAAAASSGIEYVCELIVTRI